MTLRVDCDLLKWLYVPTEWPWEGFASPQEWSVQLADETAVALGYDASTREWLQITLEGLAQNVGPAEYRFVYFVDPNAILSFVSLYEVPRQDDSFEDLLGMGDSACIRPPQAVRFNSSNLGNGMKSMRFVADANDREITGISHWAWRQDDRDIVMIAAGQNIAEFGMLQDEFDEFAQSISVIGPTFHLASSEA